MCLLYMYNPAPWTAESCQSQDCGLLLFFLLSSSPFFSLLLPSSLSFSLFLSPSLLLFPSALSLSSLSHFIQKPLPCVCIIGQGLTWPSFHARCVFVSFCGPCDFHHSFDRKHLQILGAPFPWRVGSQTAMDKVRTLCLGIPTFLPYFPSIHRLCLFWMLFPYSYENKLHTHI